jgi:dATP pyrophosphohydrolase
MQTPVTNTVEVCIFKLENGFPSYLLLRRAGGEKLYPGIWQFVTGTIQPGENPVEAALRELREETGLEPEGFWVAPHVNSFYDTAGHVVNLSPLFAARVTPGVTPLLSAEHSEFVWLSREAAAPRLVWPGQRAGLNIVHEYIALGGEAAQLTQIK